MVRSCLYCGAKANAEKKRTFHGFPLKEPERLNVWLKNMNLQLGNISATSKLCSDHFERKYLRKSDTKVTLAVNSVPNLFGDYKSCCVYCKAKKSIKESRVLHRFPFAKPEVLRQWLLNMSMPDLELVQGLSLCSDHFAKSSYYAGGKLKPNAVPIKFPKRTFDDALLPDSEEPRRKQRSSIVKSSLAEAFQSVSTKCNDGSSMQDVYGSLEKKRVSVADIPENVNNNSQRITLSESSSTSITNIELKRNVLLDHNYEDTPHRTKKKLEKMSNVVIHQRKIIKVQKQKIKRMTKRITSLKDVVNELTNRSLSAENELAAFNSIADTDISEFLQRFLKNCSSNTVSQEEYPPVLRSFALTLYFYSPEAYHFVRQKFCKALPDISTLRSVLQSWYTSVDGEPGFTSEDFEALKLKVEAAATIDEKIQDSFMFDEIEIKKEELHEEF